MFKQQSASMVRDGIAMGRRKKIEIKTSLVIQNLTIDETKVLLKTLRDYRNKQKDAVS